MPRFHGCPWNVSLESMDFGTLTEFARPFLLVLYLGLFNFFLLLLLLLVLYDEGITLILTSVFCGRTTRCSPSCSEQDTSASFRTWEAALGAC